MKHLLLTLILCCYYVLAKAQSHTGSNLIIQGKITDSTTNLPMSYVTLALKSVKTQTLVLTTLSKSDGRFEMKALNGRRYDLIILMVGYGRKTFSLKDTSGNINLGEILLSPSSKHLKEVSITATRPLIKQEVDRITYDIQADPESKVYSVLEIMRKVPFLSVDGNDNIRLKGSGNYKILINGKESALMTKNPSDVLKSMPATNIEKIDVITTPPSKYDAEGLAGIINIITKKQNIDQGYNIGMNSKYNTLLGPSVNINGTYKEGKFGLTGYAGLGHKPNLKTPFETTQRRFANDAVLIQNGNYKSRSDFYYTDAELSYEIDPLNLLTGSFTVYKSTGEQDNDQIFTQTISNQLTQGYTLFTNGINNYKGLDAVVNYQLGFKDHKDELLTLSYKYSYSPGQQSADNVFFDRFNYNQTAQPDFKQSNATGNKEHTIQLDYAYPHKKINIEGGAKAILRHNYSDFRRDDLDSLTNTYIINDNQTNTFDYQQRIYSVYNAYLLKLGKWTAKTGVRFEHTNISADFSGTPLDKGYDNFIPAISVQRNLKKGSINFGFTQRIQRPGIYQLNPFINRSNPKFISTGNPDLRPELNNTFELSYSNFSKGFINATLDYAFSNNAIQNVSSIKIDQVLNNKSDTVTTSTFQNLGSNRSLGLNLASNFPISKKLLFNINARFMHIWLKGVFNDQFYRNSGFTGNAYANLTYRFTDGYRLGIDGGYYSGDVTLQGKNGTDIFTSFVVSKEFLKKALNISLVANNPYSTTRTFKTYTNTPDFLQSTYYENRYRSFAVRMNYKFGKLKSEIKKNKRGINNDDIKPGGKNEIPKQ